MVNALEDARPVTIVLLQGGVYGGATDWLWRDFRLGSVGTEMFMPAARLGLHFYRRGLSDMSRAWASIRPNVCSSLPRRSTPANESVGFLTHLVAADALCGQRRSARTTLAGMAPLAYWA
jgi:hypothetical protein